MLWIEFLLVAAVIFYAGSQLARYGDILAEKTGMGGTWIGLVLVASTTSLPELFTGLSSVLQGLPDIAVGNIMGSGMFNLVTLSLMDAGSRAPLIPQAQPGHALAVACGVLLTGLVGAGLVIDPHLPPGTWIGPITPLLILIYLASVRGLFLFERRRILVTPEVKAEMRYGQISTRIAGMRYAAAAVVVVLAALLLPGLAEEAAERTGLGQAWIGTVLVGVTTALPELVVTITAVRLGAIDLGIGNVLGSNLFNILILALDDIAYTGGPLLQAASPSHLIAVLCAVLMYGLFLAGLTYRASKKRLKLAWDTSSILAVYVLAITLIYALRDAEL
jgi:cation:H+ antiporter